MRRTIEQARIFAALAGVNVFVVTVRAGITMRPDGWAEAKRHKGDIVGFKHNPPMPWIQQLGRAVRPLAVEVEEFARTMSKFAVAPPKPKPYYETFRNDWKGKRRG